MIKAILLATVVPFMSQHRNITPSVEVSTNFWGSVTGVVTRTYIAERGGGGLTPSDVGLIATNVVTNVVTKSYVEGLGVVGSDTNVIDGLIHQYDITNLTGRINAKRGLTDLAVYGNVWNFAPFEAVKSNYTYRIVNDGGTNYVDGSSKVGFHVIRVCTLVDCQSSRYGIGYAVDEILNEEFSSCAGVEIFKTAIGATSDTLAKISDITNVVTGVNILHYNGSPATTFVESTATLMEYIMSGKPLFCSYNTIWARYESITPVDEYSGYVTFVCNNQSSNVSGVASPLVIRCFLDLQNLTNYVSVGTCSLLEDNFSALTNSVNFKSAVETLIPDPVVTNLYNPSRTHFIDGDRNIYTKLPFSAWTNNTAGGGGSIPAGLRFTPSTTLRGYNFAWEAKNGNDLYWLGQMNEGNGYAYFDLLKNWDTPFPSPSVEASESATVLDFRTFKLYKFGSGETLIKTGELALSNDVETVDAKIESRTFLVNKIGEGNDHAAGLLGLFNGSDTFIRWPFSYNYWSNAIYPNVKSWVQTWVGNNYVPKTRKINGQSLTTDITIQAMDYQAVTNTVNAVKEQFYDQPLQVNWTLKMVNGEMKLYATTNVNMSVL